MVAKRTLGFLTLVGLAAGSFFAATLVAFLSMPLQAFSTLGGALALSTIIGAVLQLGSAYSLPAAARQDSKLLDQLFLKLLILIGTLVSAVALLTPFLPVHDILRLGVMLGAAKAVHILCDSYLRARTRILMLSSLNASLHFGLFVGVLWLAHHNSLTPTAFVYSMIATKIMFSVLTLALSPPEWRSVGLASAQLALSGGKGSSAVVLIFALGTYDIVVLSLLNVDVPAYIAIRHFGYGLFMTIIQESAIPLILSKLIKREDIPKARLLGVAIVLATLVGCAAVGLGYVLLLMRVQDPMALQTGILVFASLASHAAAVLIFNAGYVTGALSTRFLKVGVLAMCGILAFGLMFGAENGVTSVVFCSVIANLTLAVLAWMKLSAAQYPSALANPSTG